MRFYYSTAALLVVTASLAVTQDKLCDAASASKVSRDGSVFVQKITLSGKWGRNDATVYLPDQGIAEERLSSHTPLFTRRRAHQLS
jgi:hypothetical protein